MFRSIFRRQNARCLFGLARQNAEINPQTLAVLPHYFCSVSTPVTANHHRAFPVQKIQFQIQVRQYTDHSYTDLTYEQFQSLLESKDVQVFDVREPEECRSTGMIPGAVNIPLGEVKEAFQMNEEKFIERYNANKPSKIDRNVIFYGLGPIKSTAALELVQKVGYTKARHLIGGWEEWSMRQKGEK